MTDLTQQVEEARKKARREVRRLQQADDWNVWLDRLIALERAEAIVEVGGACTHEPHTTWCNVYRPKLEAAIAAIMEEHHGQ